MAKMNTCFVQCVCLNIGARDTPVKENQIPCTKIGPTQCNVLVTHFFSKIGNCYWNIFIPICFLSIDSLGT